jgi:hypothetical protein
VVDGKGTEGLLFVAGKGLEASDARTQGSSISKSQFESALIRIQFGEELRPRRTRSGWPIPGQC